MEPRPMSGSSSAKSLSQLGVTGSLSAGALAGKPPAAPELLAPAGDQEGLRAAVANGADAVYFGLEDFNARRRATNFTLAGLPEIVRRLHRHNVKGYIALNTLI